MRPLIKAAFEVLPDVEVRLFETGSAPNPKTMEVRTKRPRMTPGRAAIVKVLDTYHGLNYGLSMIEVQIRSLPTFSGGRRADEASVCEAPRRPVFRHSAHALNTMEGTSFEAWVTVLWKPRSNPRKTHSQKPRRSSQVKVPRHFPRMSSASVQVSVRAPEPAAGPSLGNPTCDADKPRIAVNRHCRASS